MQTVVIVIHLMIVSAMIGLVLLQRCTSNVLTRTTAILAAAFFATSLILSILAGWDRKPRSILTPAGTPATAPAPATPGGPGTAPMAPGGILNPTPAAPAAPPAPSGPQVPKSQ